MIFTDGVHLISDTSLEELHAYAVSVGIKRCWFHASSKYFHYDIPKRRRETFATTYQIQIITAQEIVGKLKAAGLHK
jgi:hypothetical protein